MANKTQEFNYETAVRELETILQELDSPQTKLDELQKKIHRAGELLRFCRAKLRDITAETAQLRNPEPSEPQHGE